jgi:hypothetical protein
VKKKILSTSIACLGSNAYIHKAVVQSGEVHRFLLPPFQGILADSISESK